MGSDKLNLTANAAGFAMACDETVAGPAQRVRLPVAAQPGTADRAAASTPAFASLKATRSALSWSFVGWSFGKTA